MTKSNESKDRDFAQKMAESISLDLRLILKQERTRIEEFEKYVDSWDEALRDPDTDPRTFLQPYVIDRAFEQVENIHHVHTGSTDHMYFRTFRTRVLKALAGREY